VVWTQDSLKERYLVLKILLSMLLCPESMQNREREIREWGDTVPTKIGSRAQDEYQNS
jgi:hypothetical protein